MLNNFRPEDFQQRLHGSIVKYDGAPVLVGPDEEGGRNHFTLMPICPESSFPRSRVSVRDAKLDISTPELGYFQFQNHAIYAERLPRRRYHQGLCNKNVRCSYLIPEGLRPSDYLLQTIGYERSVKGLFPSLDMAISTILKGSRVSIAVSRDIALTSRPSGEAAKKGQTVIVFFKKEEVGWLTEDKKTVKVPTMANSWIVSRYLSELNWEID